MSHRTSSPHRSPRPLSGRFPRDFVPAALACLAMLAPLARAAAGPALQAESLKSGEIKDAIDGSVAWLCTTQHKDTGAYGGGIEETAYALVALASSPRAYRAGDGPFVDRAAHFLLASQRPDGAFAAAETAQADAQRLTNLSLDALQPLGLLGPDEGQDALARAVAFLGQQRTSYFPADAFREQEAAVVRARASGMLRARAADGSWNQKVKETAIYVHLLSQAYSRLAELEPAASRSVLKLPAFDRADKERVVTGIGRGARYLLGVAEKGLWGAPGHPDAGFTALVLGALQALPEPRPDDVQASLDAGLDWLVSLQHEDGSIHQGQLANYVTSASVLALVRADRAADRPVIARARDFLKQLQADEGEGYAPSNRYYGGVGYGDDQRPDLSNLQLAMEALSAAGLDPGDEAFVKAVKFLERTQNRSESNDLVMTSDGAVIKSGDDGGAAYAPGESKAGFTVLADGTKVPRSYGSMTYALLKGYLFAGLDREDPRVRAAWEWCTAHYTLDVNPGFEAASDPAASYQGLFYYFYTMSHALDLYGQELVVDSAGSEHPWRAELSGRILSMQRQDGSWINANSPRWYEGNPVLATAYALLVLDSALPE